MRLDTYEITLNNGLKVYGVRKKDLPILQMNFVTRCGAAYDPPELLGLASITTDLLEDGPPGMNEIEVAKALEMEGALVSTNTSYSYSSVSFKSLSADPDQALEILKRLLFEPALRPSDLEREKILTINGFLMDFSEPAKVAEYVFHQKLFNGHPVGHDVDGKIETVKKIGPRDVRKFYKNCYTTDNSFLVVVSDFDEVDFLNKFFGEWKTKRAKKEEIPPFTPREGSQVTLVDMPVSQSVIRMGYVGVDRKSPDFNALRVANYILGEAGFSSRLLVEVRSKSGFSYSINALIDPGYPFENVFIPGRFSINFETSVETTNAAIDRTMEVLEEFISNGITEKELKEAKQYYEGSLPRKLLSYTSVLATRLHSVLFGLDPNYFLKDLEEIKNLTVEDVNRVIREFYNLDRMNLLIVTDLSKFKLESSYFKGVPQEILPVSELYGDSQEFATTRITGQRK